MHRDPKRGPRKEAIECTCSVLFFKSTGRSREVLSHHQVPFFLLYMSVISDAVYITRQKKLSNARCKCTKSATLAFYCDVQALRKRGCLWG